MINFFKVEEHPGSKKFVINMTEPFYNYVGSLIVPGREGQVCSYGNIFHHLYGLKPSEFHRYVMVEFNAVIIQLGYLFIIWGFNNRADAQKFCDDVNGRFNYYMKFRKVEE